MIVGRIATMAENKGRFHRYKAGFRKGRNCTDQVLWLVQQIDDGFQKKQKSILALLDLSKEYGLAAEAYGHNAWSRCPSQILQMDFQLALEQTNKSPPQKCRGQDNKDSARTPTGIDPSSPPLLVLHKPSTPRSLGLSWFLSVWCITFWDFDFSTIVNRFIHKFG